MISGRFFDVVLGKYLGVFSIMVFVGAVAIWPAPVVGAPKSKGVYDVKLYNPETRSYFEMVDFRKDNPGNIGTWRNAGKVAERRHFKGVRGRLAVIKTRETH